MNKSFEDNQLNLTKIKIDINGLYLNLKKTNDIEYFRELIFPWHFLLHFDNIHGYTHDNREVEQLKKLSKQGGYKNWEYLTPHGTLLYQYKTFIKMISLLPDIAGKKLIEIGTGKGGVSYSAKSSGFDVICTNFPLSAYEKSTNMLNLNPKEFRMGSNSFTELLQKGEKADIIFSNGVPFNRDSSRNSKWIKNVDFLYSVFEDATSSLPEKGFLFSWHNYQLNRNIIKELANRLMSKIKCKVFVQFLYKKPNNKLIEVTDLTIIKGYDCQVTHNRNLISIKYYF